VYGSLLQDVAARSESYARATQTGPLFDNPWAVGFRGGAAIAGGAGYTSLELRPSLTWRILDVALSVELARNHAGYGLHSFRGGVDGALDLLDHVTVGRPRDSLYFTMGRIDELTIGDGIVVHDFRNANPYSLYQPVGLVGQADLGGMACIDGFIADITSFSIGGLRIFYHSLGYYAGVGYYYDANQYHALPSGAGNRFVGSLPDSVPEGEREHVHIVEGNLGIDVIQTDLFGMSATGAFAYKFKTLMNMDGLVIRVPTLSFSARKAEFGLGYHTERRRLVFGQFNWMYSSNRYRVTNPGGTTEVLTQNSVLDLMRLTRGFHIFARVMPLKGFSIEGEYRQELQSHDVFEAPGQKSRKNYDFSFEAAINDTLVPFIKHCAASVQQTHGALYPPDASSAAWGFRTRFHLLTTPLLFNTALECGLEYYTIDIDGSFNNSVDSADRVFEFFLGLRWGFL
jgi:hypothetical protein